MRDLRKGGDPQLRAIQNVIADVSPDILLLTDFDYDLDALALGKFALMTGYPHHFAARPNTGMATGLDLDGDGYRGDARDAQGYGRFAGDGGMAILSRMAIDPQQVRSYSDLLWRDLPGAVLPQVDGQLFPSDAAIAVQRLSTGAHWIVPVGPVSLLAWSATPPVFDGPEDRNGLRARDELRLTRMMIDDVTGPFVVLGNANLDPVDGQGHPDAMAAFLADPRIQDPRPTSAGAKAAADPRHAGDPATDTADWPDDGPGNLRVSYVLPSADLQVTGAGVFWPKDDAGLVTAGAHRLVWVDIAVP